MAEKKTSIKKIIIAAVLIILVAAIALAVGIKKHKDYYTPKEYEVQTLNFSFFEGKENVKLIAHRGFRAIAPENTIPAYDRAGEASFWGAECDIYRTTDGVWVLMHDDTVNRMTDGKGKIEEKSYEELMKFTVDNGNSVTSYPNTKIATLDEYLAVCEDTGMTAVIELKGSNNTEHYNEIVDTVKKHKVDVVYIAFGADNLKEMRKLDEKSPMFLLVHKIDDKAIETAKEIGGCGINFNASVKNNLKNDGAAIKKIVDAGLPAAAWTVDSIDQLETLFGYGVEYITTDCITY